VDDRVRASKAYIKFNSLGDPHDVVVEYGVTNWTTFKYEGSKIWFPFD